MGAGIILRRCFGRGQRPPVDERGNQLGVESVDQPDAQRGYQDVITANTRSSRLAAVIDLAFTQVAPSVGICENAGLIIRRSPFPAGCRHGESRPYPSALTGSLPSQFRLILGRAEEFASGREAPLDRPNGSRRTPVHSDP